MAILKKRTSSRQLPEAKGLDRAPLDSVIRGGSSTPSISGGSSSLTSTGGGSKPAITTQTGKVPKTTLTSTTGSGSKPAVTTTTPKTPTSITTSPSTTTKPTVKPNISNPNSTTNKIVNALSGAAIGAGTKLLVDKLTGKVTSTGGGSTSAPPTPAQVAAKKKADELNAAANKSPTSVVSGPRTDTQIQAELDKKAAEEDARVRAELDKVKASEEPWTPPEGAINNGDGTYSVIEDGMKTTYGSDGSTIGMELAEDSLTPKDVTEAPFEPEYFQDSLGNIYASTADGGYQLYRAAEVAEDVADNTWTDPSSGDTWKMSDSGEWIFDSYGNQNDQVVADNNSVNAGEIYKDPDTGYTWVMGSDGAWFQFGGPENTETDLNDYTTIANDEDPYLYAGNDQVDVTDYPLYPDEIDYAKGGGLITMMKNGGGIHMATGGYLPEGAVDNGDGTYTIGRFTYSMDTDEWLYSSDDGAITSVNPDSVYSTTPQQDYYDTDSLGNIFKNGKLFMDSADVPTPIQGAGSGNRSTEIGNLLSKGWDTVSGLGKDALSGITGALGTTAGAAGAGALVASLLGQDFSGGTGSQNQGLDMSKVGLINPRTTDFGIGPTKFVGYEDYGTGGEDYTPNAELLKNLNAPRYNPVNEGDYGYEDAPAETPKMASGGLSSMATPVASYYTFGQPADILANLGMRAQPPANPPEMTPQIGQQQAPQQAQQQGLPQQAPPMASQQMSPMMPQQGTMPQQQGMPPPMRKGGLPHVSDVPVVEGRMDFRRGSAVHGEGDGQSDDIPAMLADGEYVIDAETVAQIGNGSTKAGAQALDKFRESIRAHKRSAPVNKIPPKTKALTSYLKG